MQPETRSSQHTKHSLPLPLGPKSIFRIAMSVPISNAIPSIYMNNANTTPSPATVTKPPLCESIPGAPAVVDLTVAGVVVDEEEFPLAVAEALVPAAVDDPVPFEAFTLAVELFVVLSVALVAAPVSVLLAVFFPAFVEDEDCVFFQL